MVQIVDVVVGGQYGSEAKGHVTAQLIQQAVREARLPEIRDQFGIEVINIRVAGPNAGHTAYDSDGRKFAFRSLPVGAVIDPEVLLYIAPGSEVDLPVLYEEIRIAEDAGHPIRGRLYMSKQATLIEDTHKEREAGEGLVGRVGSTGKGIGAARADRIMRTAKTVADAFEFGVDRGGDVQPWAWAEPEDLYADDSFAHDTNQHVIIEGTQGYGLSLRASGHYPQVTSSDARSVDFLAMAGIDPTRCGVRVQNWVVTRVHPIRVAGNSGPMKGETSWTELGLDEEKTTVTQKVRRVGTWDQDLVRRAVQANGGHSANVVVTMLDQIIPGLAEITDEDLDKIQTGELQDDDIPQALQEAAEWINAHASVEQIGAPVAGFTFSPTKILFTAAAQRGQGPEQVAQELIDDILGGVENEEQN